MAVWCTGVCSDANQEIHHIVMAAADGIVKGSDALVIWLAGVTHLGETFYTKRICYLICKNS